MTHLDLFGIPATGVGWAAVWTSIGYAVSHWIKTRPRIRELEASADGSLRKDLMTLLESERKRSDGKIERLEKQLIDERADCTRRIEALEEIAFGKGAASTLHPGPE